MKLGQGSHKRAPRWIWAAMFIGCAVALPSGSIGVGQDVKKTDAVTTAQAIGPAPRAKGDFAKHWQSYREDVGDLLDALKEQGKNEEEARQSLLSQLSFRQMEDTESANPRAKRIIIDADVESDLGLHGKVSVSVPAPQILDRQLEVFDTDSKIEAIKAKLNFLRAISGKMISCEVKIVSLSQDAFKDVSKNWVKVSSPTDDQIEIESAVAEADVTQVEQLAETASYLLNDQNSDAILTRKDVYCEEVPRVTGRSGQAVFINFHPNLKPVDEKRRFLEGTCLELMPRMMEGDKMSLQAKCLLYNREFQAGEVTDKKRWVNETGGHGKRVLEAMRLNKSKSPKIEELTKRLAASLYEQGNFEGAADTFDDLLATYPNSEHHLLACEAQFGQTIAFCVPTKIGEENGVLALLVRCSVVDSPKIGNSAQETMVLPGDANGVVNIVGAVKLPERYKLDKPTTVAQAIASAGGIKRLETQGSMFQVMILREMDEGSDYNATDFMLDSALLGKERTPADEIWLKQNDIIVVKSVSPAIETTQVKTDSRTSRKRVFKRATIIGPVTEGEQPHAISPPTAYEVLAACNIQRIRRIELLKLSESENEKRFIPLIGNAVCHHTFYLCTMQSDESDEQQLVIIDHNHFHMDK